MEAGTLKATTEDNQQEGGLSVAKEAAQFAGADAAAKAKETKLSPERKRSRNLSEDKRFKLISGTANPALAEEIGRHIGVPVGGVIAAHRQGFRQSAQMGTHRG